MTARCFESVVTSHPAISVRSFTHRSPSIRVSMIRSRVGCAIAFTIEERASALAFSLFNRSDIYLANMPNKLLLSSDDSEDSVMSLRLLAEGGIESLGRYQRSMISLFHDPAPIQDKDLVCVADGGESMGDDEAGASIQQVGQRFLNESFGGVVHTCCGLIEDENGWILEQGTRDRKALLLADTQLHTTLSKLGVQTLGQTTNESLGIRGVQRLPHLLFGGVRLADEQVVSSSPIEEETLLGHHGNGPAQRA